MNARRPGAAARVATMAAHLQSWPADERDKLLEALGVPAADRELAERRADPRRCLTCGNGYVRCRQIDEKAPESERHEWAPDRARGDV